MDIFARTPRMVRKATGDGANMSQAKEVPDTGDRTINKKTDIVCYLNREEGETRRQFADRVDDTRDYFNRVDKEREYSDYFLVKDGHEISLDYNDYKQLKDADLGDLTLNKVVHKESDRAFEFSPRKPLKSMYRSMLDVLYEEMEFPEGFEKARFSKRLVGPDDQSISYRSSFERMPMLKHQSEISQDDMYENEDEEYLAFKLKVSMRNMTEGDVTFFDENLLAPLVKKLGKHEWVQKVRLYNCETETSEKGVCWNI